MHSLNWKNSIGILPKRDREKRDVAFAELEKSILDREAFEQAKLKVLLKQHDPHGFGTLQEKTVHAVMKLYYEPNEDYHEVPIEGYIADIYTGERIIEI